MQNAAFATWFQGQLKRRDWTQADFARRINLSPQVVSRWYRGDRVPSPAYCDLIADAFLIDLDIVLWQAGHRPIPERVNPDDPSLEIHGLVDRIDWTIPGHVRMARSVLGELARESKEGKPV